MAIIDYCYLVDLPPTIKILETDDEIRGEYVGAFRNYRDVNSFISQYRTEFKRSCERRGVFSIKDLVENQVRQEPYGFVAEQLLKKNAQSRTPHPH